MAEVNQAKLDKLAKAGKTQAAAAGELGITPGQLGMLQWGKALVRVGKLAKAPKSEASFKKLRAGGMRFEFIAAATGASVGEVKAVVGDVQIARGRKSSNGGGSSTRRSATKRSPAKRSGAKSSNTSSKRGGAKRGGAGRARTRAERANKSGNPS